MPPPGAGQQQGRSLPVSGDHAPAGTLIVTFRETMNFFCLESPSLWRLGMAPAETVGHCAVLQIQVQSLRGSGFGEPRGRQEEPTCNVVTESNGR